MSSIDSTKASSLIQEQVAKIIVEPLMKESVVLSAPGITVFNSSEPFLVPTLNAPISTAMVGENELIPEADAQFGEIELMPKERKSVKTLVRVSNELVRMATMGVSAVLQNRIVKDVRDKVDTAFLVGTGSNNEITGLVNVTGLPKSDFTATDPDSVLDGLAKMSAKEAVPNRLFMSGADFYSLRKIKDNDGRYLMQENVHSDTVYSLHGVPVSITNKLPTGTALLADMSAIAVVVDQNPTVTLDTSRYLEYDQTAIRVTARYDIGVLQKDAVMVLKTG